MPTKIDVEPIEKTNAREAEPLTIIGKPQMKVDAMAKVSGETLFADDLALPRMLFCKLLRSPHPHARILRIDVSKAQAMPGVVATLVGSELPIPFGILPVSQDEHALCLDKVRFVGDPVAAVAALDEETAEGALRLIDVDYKVLPEVMSIEEALAPDASVIHEDERYQGNVQKAVSLQFGDVDEGFAEADTIREDTFFFEGNTHLPLEQHAALASYGADGKLTLWSSTQTPHYVHRAMAKVLEMPPSRIRVIACPNGGGFGGKSDPFNHEIVVAKLSLKTRRPVKVTLNREEVFYCHRGRHPVAMWVKTGVKKNGDITAMHFRSFLDGGAYGSYGVASLYYTGALQTVTYKIPRYKFEGLRVFTNKPPFLHQLGIRVVFVHGGGPQSTELAKALGIETRMVEGRRVTCEKTLEVTTMVLNGLINTKILAHCRELKLPAVGLSGVDAGLIKARRRSREPIDFGYVGDIAEVGAEVLEQQLQHGYVPIVSPLSADNSGTVLNINADTVASALAVAMKAEKLILATGARGILENPKDPKSVVSYTDLAGLERLKRMGSLEDGMMPKASSIEFALNGGVPRVHVISYEEPDALLLEVFTNEGTGTLVVKGVESLTPEEQKAGALQYS